MEYQQHKLSGVAFIFSSLISVGDLFDQFDISMKK